MTLSTISSELLTPQQPNLVWWYTIISQSVVWKNWVTVFKVKVTQKVKMSVFVQKISSKLPNILLPNLVLWSIIMSQSVMQKDWFAIFKVKVTARAHMIQIRQFLSSELLIHLLPNLLDDTSSKARVSYKEIWLLWSKSRSQQNLKMSVTVWPDDISEPLPFTTNLVTVMHPDEPELFFF